MKSLSSILHFCNNILETEKFSDYCKNGLQISGKSEVKKIALGVTASKNFLEQAAQWGADLCICHHGLIFGKIEEINDVLKARLQICLAHNMGVAGFHLPLDAHVSLGNNAVICDILKIEQKTPVSVGFTGNLKHPEKFSDFITTIEKKLNTTVYFSRNFGPPTVRRICVISGGSSRKSLKALESEADTFLFGELTEDAFHELKERNINFIAAGHYATEVFGVQALGKKIQEEYPEIETTFLKEEVPI